MMRRIVVFLALAALLLALLFGVSVGIQRGQLAEIDLIAGNAVSRESSNLALSVRGRLEYLRARLDVRGEELSQVGLESRIQVVSSRLSLARTGEGAQVRLPPVTYLVRKAFGAETESLTVDRGLSDRIGTGFFLERNRRFTDAGAEYGRALDGRDLPASIREAILLHRAYCFLETGDYDQAESISTLLQRSSEREIRESAAEMLSLIDRFRALLSGLGANPPDTVDTALAYYRALRYEDAENVLNRVIAAPGHDPSSARYYLARISETTGDFDGALREYARLLIESPDSEYASAAARRTLMLDSFYDADTDPVLVSESREKLVGEDDGFLDRLDLGALYRPKPQESAADSPSPNNAESADSPASAPGPKDGDLYVRTDPIGASVYLDGNLAGTSPLYLQGIAPGTHRVAARLLRQESRTEATVTAGRVSSVELTLRSTVATLRVTTALVEPLAYLDGTPLGSDPFGTWTDLDPGQHVLTVMGTSPAGDALFYEVTINLVPGDNPVTVP